VAPLLKTLVFTVVVPGSVVILVPRWLLGGFALPRDGALALAGGLLFCLGACLYLRCAWDFATVGRGTPAPIDPPRELVVSGPFRYVRNPFYVGIVSMLLAEAVLFRSGRLLWYAALFFVCFHWFVVLYEEPALRARFGEGYLRYCTTVRRWVPRLHAWTGPSESDLSRDKSK
jgi:protein-S-isoprenylcysteine O-methyltransferase Ste14